MKINAANFG